MDTAKFITTFCGMAGCIAALVVILSIPARDGSVYSKGARAFSAAACLVLALVSLIDTVHALGLAVLLEPVEESVDMLFAPFVLFAAYSLFARKQLNDAQASKQRVVEAGELTRRVMETTPAGIVMLDAEGNITFSNETARQLLDLGPEPGETGAESAWRMRVSESPGATRESIGFAALLTRDPLTDANMVVEWPTGWRRRMSVNTTPLVSPDGEVSGIVAAFIEREPWLSRAANGH